MEYEGSELIGWRMWALSGEYEPVLTSINGAQWAGPTLTADKAPEAGTRHGIYALKDKAALLKSGYLEGAQLFGTVALSGTVVEGETGFRAERGTMRDLVLLNAGPYWAEKICLWELVGILNEKYQIDIQMATAEDTQAQYRPPTHGNVVYGSSHQPMIQQIQNQIGHQLAMDQQQIQQALQNGYYGGQQALGNSFAQNVLGG